MQYVIIGEVREKSLFKQSAFTRESNKQLTNWKVDKSPFSLLYVPWDFLAKNIAPFAHDRILVIGYKSIWGMGVINAWNHWQNQFRDIYSETYKFIG